MMNSLSVAQLPVGYNGLSLEQLRARARRHVDEVCQNIISNFISGENEYSIENIHASHFLEMEMC